MAIDKPGGTNAGIFAAEIIGTADPAVRKRLETYKEELARSVAEKNGRLQLNLAQNQKSK